MREYQQHIGGEWIGADRLFDDFDPHRGTVMARVPAGTRADAARAVDAAAAAFPAWAELPPAAKQTLFLRAADIVDRRRDEIVALLATETGCAGAFAGFQVWPADRLRGGARQQPDGGRRAAAAARRGQGQRLGSVRAGLDGGLHRASRDYHQGRHRFLPDLDRLPTWIACRPRLPFDLD